MSEEFYPMENNEIANSFYQEEKLLEFPPKLYLMRQICDIEKENLSKGKAITAKTEGDLKEQIN